MLIRSCPLFGEFLPFSFNLISLWDLGWVKTGLRGCGKKELLTEDESREFVDTVYASTRENTLQASNESPVSPESGRPTGCKAAGSHKCCERLLFQNTSVCACESLSLLSRITQLQTRG